MARAILELLVEAIDKASGTLEGIQGKAAGLGKTWDAAAGAIRVGAIAGGAAFAGFAAVAVKAASEDEAATARMTKALENYVTATGGGADELGRLTDSMNERIAAGQKLAFSDDEVRDSMQALLAATGDYDQAAQRQAAAMDLARARGIPLADASKLLAKLNAENVEIFRRMGIVLGENATETDALAAVQAKFGGQAETYAKSTEGQFTQAKIQLSELAESFGYLLLPAVTKLATEGVELLGRFSAWFEEHRAQIEAALSGIGAVAGTAFGYFKSGLETIWPILQTVFNFIFDNKPIMIAALVAIGLAVTAAFGPVGVATVAILGIITAIGYLRDNWRDVLAAVEGFILDHSTLIAAIFGPVGAVIVAFVQFRDFIGSVFGWLGDALAAAGTAFETLRTRVQGAMDWIGSKVVEVYNRIKPLLDVIGGAVGILRTAAGAFGIPGFASGTGSAPGGLSWVGENGPELVNLPQGASVYPARQSARMAGDGGGMTVILNITQPLGTPAQIADAVTSALDYMARSGRRVLSS